MRKVITLAAAAAMLSVAAVMSGPAQAMPLGAPAGVLGAAETINPIEKAACWRYGWHGWGWYPCGYYVRPGYGYGYGYGYRRGWGWGGHWGGGGHWHHSDIALKHDVVLLRHLDNGLGLYRFSYNGSDKSYVGVMAQEVEKIMPSAVRRERDGYLSVNYDQVGVAFQTWDHYKASHQ
jgi:CubicO group peptidase (beta-lactamase class C family)